MPSKLLAVIKATTLLVAFFKEYMNLKAIILLFFFLIDTQCFASDEMKMGLCDLDRTVESYDPKTWLSAKTRSLRDVIPIRFNENVIFLGFGNDKNVYTVKRKFNKENDSTIFGIYEYADGTTILLSSSENNTVIIFSASEMGPFFLGNCEMKKL